MITQLQPDRYSCTATALAMCMDLPVKEVIRAVGHDGIPLGFRDQELIEVALKFGYALVQHPAQDTYEYSHGPVTICFDLREVMALYRPGIVFVTQKTVFHDHAYALDEDGILHDPSTGVQCLRSDLVINRYYSIHQIKSNS